MPLGRSLVLLALIPLVACDDETNPAPIDAAMEGMGCGGLTYAHVSPTTATLRGSGFDEFEGITVYACLLARQSFSGSCQYAVIEDGAFSVRATVCTGGDWLVFLDSNGDGMFEDPDPAFRGSSDDVTPSDFACGGARAGAPAPACDAGAAADADAGS